MPRIYIADLAAYNAGFLHGTWVDVSSDAEEMQAHVDAMLAESPVGDEAEEYVIHDTDGIDLGEYTSLEDVAKKVAFIEEIERKLGSDGAEILEAFEDYFGRDATDDADTIRDAYCGHYRSEVDYAEQFADDVGMLSGVPEGLLIYFDYEAFARDLFANDVVMSNGHVFRRSW